MTVNNSNIDIYNRTYKGPGRVLLYTPCSISNNLGVTYSITTFFILENGRVETYHHYRYGMGNLVNVGLSE